MQLDAHCMVLNPSSSSNRETGLALSVTSHSNTHSTSLGTWKQNDPSNCPTQCGQAAGGGTAGTVVCSTGSDDGCDPSAKPKTAKQCAKTADCGECVFRTLLQEGGCFVSMQLDAHCMVLNPSPNRKSGLALSVTSH